MFKLTNLRMWMKAHKWENAALLKKSVGAVKELSLQEILGPNTFQTEIT